MSLSISPRLSSDFPPLLPTLRTLPVDGLGASLADDQRRAAASCQPLDPERFFALSRSVQIRQLANGVDLTRSFLRLAQLACLSQKRDRPTTVAAVCSTHTGQFGLASHRFPVALWQALPASASYGHSVALRVAPGRRSRVPSALHVSSATEASSSCPRRGSFPIVRPAAGPG